MKIMIIDFFRHNCWGTTDYTTHYYVNGKRIRKNEYYRNYCHLRDWDWKWEDTTQYSKEKDGITRNYTVILYSPRKKHT